MEADVAAIAAAMRFDDRREIYAQTQLFPEAGLRLTFGMTRAPMVGYLRGELAAMFGIVKPSLLDDTGVPWLIGTDVCTRRAKLFAINSREWMQREAKRYRYLENFVDARNRASLRWARWVGFKVGEPEPRGPLGVDFCRISMGSL